MIIGLVGFANSGKDTVGNYLIREKEFYFDSFAYPLKDAVSNIFGWDRELIEGDTKSSREWRECPDKFWSEKFGYNFTPRMAMQLLGTEACQGTFSKKIWTFSLLKRIKLDKNTVITDTRFSHEIEEVRNNGGKLVRIKRGDDPFWVDILSNLWLDDEREQFMKQFNIHKSEWDWVGCEFDYVVDNNGGLSDLYKKVDDMLKNLK